MRWLKKAVGGSAARRNLDSEGRQRLWRRSLLAALDDDGAQVERLLSRIVEVDSGDVDAYLAMARVFRGRGEIGRSISVHQSLVLRLDLDTDRRMRALAELGVDFAAAGFTERAIAAFQEVLEHDRSNRRALTALVDLLEQVGDYVGALQMLRRKKRIERDRCGDDEAALLLRSARANIEVKRTRVARAAIKRALRKRADFAEAHVLMGDLEVGSGRHRRAIAAWTGALDADAAYSDEVFPKLAAAYGALGRTRDYEAQLRRRVDRDSSNLPARLALAAHLEASGEAEGAVAELRRALITDPTSLMAHAALGRLLLSQGRELDVLKSYGELLTELEQARR